MSADALQAPPAADLETWKGFQFHVRAATPADGPAISSLFEQVSDEDRRFRFLSAVRTVDKDFLRRMTEVDHDRTEDFLAYDGDTLIATAMVAADDARERAEVAISIRADYKNRGVGWALLAHAASWAEGRGIRLLESIESRDNAQAIGLEKEMGFTATPYPGDASLVLLQKKIG